MENQNKQKINYLYLGSTGVLMLILPVICVGLNYHQNMPLIPLMGKWFVFWGIGIRLLTAGIRQVTKPSFTAQEIFHIEGKESYAIVRELGFANICFGATGVLSLIIPAWLPAAAFVAGLYMGIAGIQHVVKKPASLNENVAMISDLFIFLLMGVYLFGYFVK